MISNQTLITQFIHIILKWLMLLVMLLNCKHLTVPLYIAMVETVNNLCGCVYSLLIVAL